MSHKGVLTALYGSGTVKNTIMTLYIQSQPPLSVYMYETAFQEVYSKETGKLRNNPGNLARLIC